MDKPKKLVGMVGLYDSPNDLVRAASRVRDAGYRKWDCHTPYPIHGLSKAMGLRWSPIAFLGLGAGFTGGALAMLMQWWMSAVDYPIMIGGKPFFSWPAFIVLTFELFVLTTALATLGYLVFFCKLGRWHSPLHDSGVMAELTSNRFAVVVGSADQLFSRESAEDLLEQTGCEDIRPLYELEEGEGWVL
jgi:hypothetical protein